MKLEITDSIFTERNGVYDAKIMKPMNHWNGSWIEKTDEYGEKIVVPAIEFNAEEWERVWKQDIKQ